MKQQLTNSVNKSGRILGLTFLTGLAIVYLLFSTTPDEVGPQGTTGFFILVYLFVLTLFEWIYRVWLQRKHHWQFWLRAVYSLIPVILLALASLRQLKTTDLVVSICLVAIVTIYHNRTIS